MSTSDFWNLVDKYKKKEAEKLYGLTSSTPGITSTRGTTPETEKFWEKVEGYQSDSIAEMYSQIAPYSTVKIDDGKSSTVNIGGGGRSFGNDDDIAPVKENSWFQKGALDDGWSLKNIGKAILGTAADAVEDVGAGILGIGEKVVDALAYAAPYVAQGQYYQNGGVYQPLEQQQMFEEGIARDKQAAAKFIAKDLYDEQKIAQAVVSNPLQQAGFNVEGSSFFGTKMDSLAQSGGQLLATAGLQAVGVPWWLTTGVTSFGGESESALKQGATMEEAGVSAAITAGAEILTEKISGGIKFGGTTLDEGLTTALSRAVSDKVVRNLAKIGMDTAGEGFEEVLSGAISAVGQKLTYMDEKEISEIFSTEDALDAFIGGAILGSVSSSFGAIKAGKDTDFTSGLTTNEEAVVRKEYEARLAEQEKDGKLTGKEKAKLYDRVVEDMDKGYISTDTIEEVLGGESYTTYQKTVKSEDSLIEQEKTLTEEYNTLNKMVNEKMTGEQQERRDELRGMLPEIRQKIADQKKNATRDQLKSKLREDVMSLAKDSRLMESYNEKGRRSQAFEADLSKYDAKQQEVIKKAVESGILNNTNRTHEFVDLVAKISADKGVLFDFTNNAKLKESGFAVDGKFVNGYVTKDGVTVNIQSAKSLNSVVGHEITHVLEGTEFYNELQSAVVEYAKAKGDYQSRYDTLTKLYEHIEGANIEAELTADLVGDYLFTDSDFISKLSTEHRNVFQKIFDEVKYLLKTATAGSKEAQQLEKVKRAFEKAYRATKNTADGGVKYSLLVKDKSGNVTTVNPYETTREQSRDYMVKSRKGELDQYTYFPVVAHTPGTIIATLNNAGIEVTDKPVAMQAKKARQSQIEGQHTEPDGTVIRHHAMTTDEIQETIDKLSDPFAAIHQKERTKTVYEDGRKIRVPAPDNFVFFVKLNSGKESVAVIEFDSNINENMIQKDGHGDEYHTTVTVFEPDKYRNGQPFDYLEYLAVKHSNIELDITKESPETETAISQTEATVSESELSAVKVAQESDSVKSDFSLSDSQGRELTKEQNEYFKNSVVRDENGNLKVMYHGTSKGGHTVFDTWGMSKYGLFGTGSYFTDSKAIAESYTKKGKGKNPQVYESYLNITNPLDMDAAAIPAEWTKAFEDVDFPESGTNEDFYRAVEEYYSDQYMPKWEVAEIIRDSIEFGMGYDGLTHIGGGRVNSDGERHQVYIAFQSEQIKNTDNVNPTSDPDIRYSLSDSQGRQLTQEQAEYFKDSKIRDEDGNLMVLYHGTPNGDFTQFKDGTYFTDNKEYADRYQNPGASSISSGKTATNPKTFEVYLDIKKPFDLSDPEARRVYIEDYIKGGNAMGINPYLSDAEYAKIETIDWAEGEDLREFLIDNGYDYDGLVLDEGADGGYGDAVQSRGTSYVVFSPEQIKNVDNQNPTSDPDIRYSMSETGEKAKTYGDYNVYGKDIALETDEDIAPVAEAQVAEEIAPVAESAVDNTQENAEPAEELFPDDTAALQKEYEHLVAEREDIQSAIGIFEAVGDTANAEKLMKEMEAVETRISEIEADESDRLSSIEEADEPVTMDSTPEDVADNVPLTKTMVAELAREVRTRLALPAKRVAEVRDLIARYSAEEFPSRAHLYAELYDRFGTFTESYVDEDLKGIKSLLRTYGISVDETIKRDIADYGQLMRSNFGKVRFSKEGLPVDVAYMEFQEVMPGLFPESIDVPADQLLRIIEVANMDVASEQVQPIDYETLEEVTNLIANRVTQFKQTRKETLANKHGRESFQSLMEDADRYAPPVRVNTSAPTRAEMTASPDDIAPVFDTESGQQALIPEPEADAPKRITRKELHERIVDSITTTFRERGYEFTEVLKNAKDLSTFATVDNTPQRVMEKALGYKEGQILADMTVNKVAQNETEGIRWLNSFTDKKSGLLAKISKQYGIKPGSKKSAAAQMYAEGFYVDENNAIVAYGDAELAKDFPDTKVQENIKKLARDPRIRMIYDETLAAINEARSRNAYPEIPRLQNYFLHFRAMEDTFSRLGLPFNPNDIRAKDLPTDLNGVTADLKPGQPYFASAMHRKGKRTSFDLLGGLEKYLTSAKNQIYHIDDIQTLRALRNYVAETYGQAHGLENLDTMSDEEAEQRIEEVYNSHLSTFAKFLNEEANVLAGKTSLIDRGLEGVIGRRGMTFMDSLNRQVGANMVGYNISSSLTNLIAPVQAFAKTNKFDFVKAMAQTAANKIGSIAGRGDNFVEESPVMIRRKGAERFYRTPYQKVADTGYVFMSTVDDLSTELIARAKYNEFTRKGMDSQQAHIETDKWVSRLMGDRSLGQQPHIYNSKTLGLITKFQLEVRNQLDSQFYDTIQEAKVSTEEIENKLLRNAKKAAKITSTFAQLAVLQHLFGKAFESIAGYNPTFDIIDVLIKTMGWDDDEEDEDTVLDNIEEGFLALLGDLPYTSTLTGGRIPIASALPVTELIKGVDQYGNEKSRWDTIKESAPYYFLPGGYGQIKKTVAGMKMFDDEHPVAGSYTDSGNLRFPVEDTLGNRIQAGLFGQWASDNARDYFDNERKPMQENQIEEFLATGMEIQDYWDYREGLSEHETLEEKVDYIAGLDLPVGTKNILVNNLTDRKEPINLADYDEYGNLEEMDFAIKYPDKYEVAVSVGGYQSYKKYQEDMKGMKLAEKADYIAGLNLSTEQKNLLINSETDRKEPIDLEGYENYSSFEEFEFAKKNPERYALAKAVGGYESYTMYADALGDIKSDKDEWGQSINGSRKPKVYDYIYSLDIPDIEKHILFKSQYPSTDDHNYEIIDYLNERDDISYDEMVAILLDLDFKVSSDGIVRW